MHNLSALVRVGATFILTSSSSKIKMMYVQVWSCLYCPWQISGYEKEGLGLAVSLIHLFSDILMWLLELRLICFCTSSSRSIESLDPAGLMVLLSLSRRIPTYMQIWSLRMWSSGRFVMSLFVHLFLEFFAECHDSHLCEFLCWPELFKYISCRTFHFTKLSSSLASNLANDFVAGTHIIEGTWKNSSQCRYSYVGGWRFQLSTWKVCNLKFSKLPSLLVHKLRNAIWLINLWILWQCPTFPLGNRTCGCCTSWLASWPTEYLASSEQTMSFLTFGECSCQVWPRSLHIIMPKHFRLYCLLRCCVILCEHNLNCQSFVFLFWKC